MARDRSNYRWAILGICWFGYIIAMMQRLSIGPLAAFLKKGLSLTNSQIGMLTSSVILGYMISLLPAGLIVDRANERYVLTFSEITGALFICCIFFASGFEQALAFLCFCGMGLGAILPATSKAILTWFPENERGTAMGIKHTAINIGGIFASVTLPTLALSFSWRHAFLFMGFFGFATAIITFIFYRPHSSVIKNQESSKNISFKSSLKHVLTNRVLQSFAWMNLYVVINL